MEALDQRPHLICFNLQHGACARAPFTPVHDGVLWRMRSCVQWARAAALPIVHVHTGDDCAPVRPAPGFDVLTNEIVVTKRTLSALAAPEWRKSSANECRRALVIGVSINCDIAASALDGAERGARIALVRDAILLERESLSAHDLATLLSPAIASVTSNELCAERTLFAKLGSRP